MRAWPVRCLRLALGVIAGVGILLGLWASPVGAAPDVPLGCLVLAGEADRGGRPNWVAVDASPGLVLRSPIGNEFDSQAVVRGWYTPGEGELTAEGWQLVAANASGETRVDCVAPERLDAVEPKPTLAWLPGAMVVGEGIRGSAEVSWDPVLDRGEAPQHYEVIVYSQPSSSPAIVDQAFRVDSSSQSLRLHIGQSGFRSETSVVVRAWWADGVSSGTATLGQQSCAPRGPFGQCPKGDPWDERWGDFSYSWTPENNLKMWWPTAYDEAGRPADGYQLVGRDNHDGQYSEHILMESFPADQRSAIVRGAFNGGVGSPRFRAFWLTGGSDGGPHFIDRITESRIAGPQLPWPSQLDEQGASLDQLRPTSALVRFTDNDCSRVAAWLAWKDLDGELHRKRLSPFGKTCAQAHAFPTGRLQPGLDYGLTLTVAGRQDGFSSRYIGFRTPSRQVDGGLEFDQNSPNTVQVRGLAFDASRPVGHRVVVQAFVNGRRVHSQRADESVEADLFKAQDGGDSRYRERQTRRYLEGQLAWYGSERGFNFNVAVPKTGNHSVCVRILEADPRPGQFRERVLDCHKVVRSPGPVGALDRWFRHQDGSMVAAGWAVHPGVSAESPKVAFFVDGKRVRQAATRQVDQSHKPQSWRFWVRLNIPVDAKRVCVIALGSIRNQHLGCRPMPR